ncbi:MAG: cytochrome ubiquinol oxidase subunit I [Anaerolineales bacterium]
MDALLYARLQFAITTVYHFFFVPLTLGLSVIVAIMETMYLRSGKEVYKEMAKYWGKLFLINFAMGVVTGIVQEFQFGMNWSEYSRFVGDIFGAPLAIEALLAFFLESTFLGIWIFGWDKLSKGLHVLSIWLVAIGSNLSALWILIANSFMQEPVGFTLRNGRAEMTDFLALVFNRNVWVQFPHTVMGGFTTGAFFVLGISAYFLLRKKQVEFFQRSFQIAAIFGAIAILLTGMFGHIQGQEMVRSQPMKMAAAEALWESKDPAPFSLVALIDTKNQRNPFSIEIPYALSILAYNKPSGEVKGIIDLQNEFVQKYGAGNYIPPVQVTFWTFRIMVGVGSLLGLLGLYALYVAYWKKFSLNKVFWAAFIWAIFFPYITNTCGWLLTEMGRYPWVVYGLMKIEDAVSPTVSSASVLFTLIGYTLIYAILMAADIYLLKKFAIAGPNVEKSASGSHGKKVKSTAASY